MSPDDPTGDTPTTPPTPREVTKIESIEVPPSGTATGETKPPGEVAKPASASPAPAPVAPAKSFLARWRMRFTIAAGVMFVLVLLSPWLLSRTVLAALIRPWLGQGEQKGGLGGVQLGWNDGMSLQRLLVPSPRKDAAPWVLLDDVRVEVGLVRAGFVAATGGTVPIKLFVGPTRITFDQGDLAPTASAIATTTPTTPTTTTTASPPDQPGQTTEPAPKTEPTPAPKPEDKGGDTLPCTIQPELEVEHVDVVLRLVPDPKVSPLRVELRGLSAKGRISVDRRLGVELLPAGDGPASLSCSLDELRIEAERPEVLTAPIVFTRPRMVLGALSLPAEDPARPVPTMQRLVLDVSFQVDALTVEGTELRDAAITITIKDGQCKVTLKAAAQGGRFEATTITDLRATLRRSTSMELTLADVEVSGGLARAAPYILPLLHSTRARTAAGGKAGLPPLSLGAKGTLDVVTSPDGAFLLKETLDTIAIPDGRIRIAPGTLAASKALDGYAGALAGLGVSGLLQGVLPTDMKFDGAEGKFTFAGGRCRVPAIDLKSKGTGVRLSGEVALGGEYELTLRSLLPADAPRGVVTAVLRAVDEAGGVRLRGNLVTDAIEPVLPDKAALERAAKSIGVDDVLQGVPLGGVGGALDGLRGLGPR